jgi:hypothetical protein
MKELLLQCGCGKVTGRVHGINLRKGNRLVCYCQSCQKFAHHLNSDLLNAFGGSDIFQIAPAYVTIEQGIDQVKSLKLTDKGAYRWYTNCCNTPIGNTASAKIPLVGLLPSFIADDQDVNAIIGPIMGNVFETGLEQPLPKAMAGKLSEKRIVFRMMRKLLIWKVLGKSKPNPFFDATGRAISKPVRVP